MGATTITQSDYVHKEMVFATTTLTTIDCQKGRKTQNSLRFVNVGSSVSNYFLYNLLHNPIEFIDKQFFVIERFIYFCIQLSSAAKRLKQIKKAAEEKNETLYKIT